MASTNPTSHAPRRSKESEKIGSFQRQEEIGRGSFATVYKAIHTTSHGSSSVVAIKSVNMGKLNKKLKENLTSEISILKGLHHPHIVALIDCKETGSHIHLVMEYVALGDLSYFIKKRDMIKNSELVGNMMTKYPNPKNGGLHEVVVRHFLQQLSSALQFLRVRNLIHRDVKPQNLLLNPSPEYFETHTPAIMPYCASEDALNPVCGIRSLPMLKIADFGFARSLPSTSLAETLCGSPLYMAPEILRYEKYDAKADLWSVGTVLYEMVTSKPPFRAANHVELLRRIEKSEDRIKFGDDIVVSDQLKKLIRSLLKRDPKERLSFPDFFSNEIITGPIPGLAPEDMPAQSENITRRGSDRRRASRAESVETVARPGKIQEPESPYLNQQQQGLLAEAQETRRGSVSSHRRKSSIAQQRPMPTVLVNEMSSRRDAETGTPASPTSRPGLVSHATAPGRQELHHRSPPPASTAMERQTSGGKYQRRPSLLREQMQEQEQESSLGMQDHIEQERAAQDIAFERDYVLVEKKAVEVNALADELDASPRMAKLSPSPQAAALMRRATVQGNPGMTSGAQTSASRAVQIASGRRPDMPHHRQNSYERRYGPSPSSATSAISKALNMASGRLFGVNFSPPVNFRSDGRSPPIGYSPFPVYPGAQSSLVMVGDAKQSATVDEDTKFVQNIEEIATRSDVVYGFAEVKYKQLTPAVPSAGNNGLGLRNADGADTAVDDLTVEAYVTVSEEALVLYVKALSLLAKAMDIAARWWARKNREGLEAAPARGTNVSIAAGQRMNNVVQWTRGRFNEVLEKADLVRIKLMENQRRLPEDHQSHPNNISAGTTSSAGMGTSVDHVVVSSGITAEKLMYDRALEMSRSAAINELTGEDLQGCEISYVTAIRMLEAVLENDEEYTSRKGSNTSDQEKQDLNDDEAPIIGLESEDRKAVKALVQSIRARLASLRKKLQVIHKRASAPTMGSPNRASPPIPHRTSTPVIAGASGR